jgi:hypothetical protein
LVTTTRVAVGADGRDRAARSRRDHRLQIHRVRARHPGVAVDEADLVGVGL